MKDQVSSSEHVVFAPVRGEDRSQRPSPAARPGARASRWAVGAAYSLLTICAASAVLESAGRLTL